LAQHLPTVQEFVATQDTFGESGTPAQIMAKYQIDAKAIEAAALRAISRKP
jgi:transketolase